MALRVAVLFLLLATPAVYAATYTVGDSSGWGTGVNYINWTKGKTFNIGDVLLFNYGGSHGVDVVDKNGYDNCDSSNALDSHSDGSTSITLSNPGSIYFMCPTMFHCGQGMKLAVNVQAAGGSPGPSTPSTPSTPTTPSSPDGSTSTAPSTSPSNSSPTTKSSAGSPNGVAGSFGNINHFMLGFSLVLAALFIRV